MLWRAKESPAAPGFSVSAELILAGVSREARACSLKKSKDKIGRFASTTLAELAFPASPPALRKRSHTPTPSAIQIAALTQSLRTCLKNSDFALMKQIFKNRQKQEQRRNTGILHCVQDDGRKISSLPKRKRVVFNRFSGPAVSWGQGLWAKRDPQG